MKKWLLIIFLILCLSWFWSKDGIKVQTKIIKNSSVIKIYFDNYLLGSALDKYRENKRLTVNFSKQDLDSKYFNNQPKTDKNNFKLPKDNYEINLVLTNPFTVRLNFEGVYPYVFYFNPYRHLNSGWEDNLNVLENKVNNQVQIGFVNGIKWILWIILKPFPFLIPIFIVLYFFKKNKEIKLNNSKLFFSKKILFFLIVFTVFSFVWSRYLMVNYLRDAPHVPDSISYIVLAKIISSGKFILPYSEIPSYINAGQIQDFFYHWFQTNKTGLFVPYLIGHPLALALGNLFGIINYIPPLVGSLTLLLIFFITYFLTQSVIFSLISMGLCFISPFFQTQTIDYMSHNSAALFILISTLPLYIEKNQPKFYLLTGFFLGMLLNTRPLTFIAVFISIMLYFIVELIEDKKFKKLLLKLIYSLIGSIIPVLIFLYYNFVTSGSVLTTPYQFHGILNKVGFGSDFKIGYGLLNTFSSLAVFSLFFLKNYYIGFFPLLLSFLLLPFSGKLAKIIIFLQFLSLSIIGIWTLYDGNFFMYGPRFIYESIPVLTILYGLTFYLLYNLLKRTNYTLISFLYIFIYFILILSFELSWLGFIKPEFSGITYVPNSIQELTNFNNYDQRFANIYKKNKGHDETYLMKNCGNWWCYSGVWLNTYPLNKSQPLFISLPENYKNNIKNGQIIDWNALYEKN